MVLKVLLDLLIMEIDFCTWAKQETSMNWYGVSAFVTWTFYCLLYWKGSSKDYILKGNSLLGDFGIARVGWSPRVVRKWNSDKAKTDVWLLVTLAGAPTWEFLILWLPLCQVFPEILYSSPYCEILELLTCRLNLKFVHPEIEMSSFPDVGLRFILYPFPFFID